MSDLFNALLLGIIEGITEFLPISSTGHLLIAEHWLGARSDLFNIAIQAGAILAVVAIYWQRLWSLALGIAQKDKRDYVLKLIVAFGVTGALGLVVKKLGFQLPEALAPIAWALLVGGFVILGVEAIDARRKDLPDNDPDAIGWGTALLVGLAQVLAGVFPGTSRSAAAIFAALLFGRSSRVAATEFAFLVGIPTMFAATGYELLHTLKDGGAAGEDWSALGVAFVVSAITAFIAVKWLLRYIQTHRFTVFAWYRIALGAALLLWLATAAAAPVSNYANAGAASDVPDARSQRAPSRAFLSGSTAAGDEAVFRLPAIDGGTAAGALKVDATRAIAKFRAAKTCVQAAMYAVDLQYYNTDKAFENPDPTLFSDADMKHELDDAEKLTNLVERAKKECPPGFDALDGSIYELALRAAQAGDEDAAACFAGGSFPMPPDLWRREDVRQRFAREAAPLIARGLQRGDWRMVPLASLSSSVKRYARAHVPPIPTSPPGYILVMSAFRQGDLEQSYALALLREVGASDRNKGLDDGFIEATAAKLTAEQRRKAEAWAQAAFAGSFHGKTWDRYDVDACPI